MNMFTIEGIEVSVVREIDGGFLAKELYSYYDEDDECSSESDETKFYPRLFKDAPTQKYADSIKALMAEQERLSADIIRLQEEQYREKSLLSKMAKFPIIQQLADYLTGDFKFRLSIRNLQEQTADSVYNSSYVKTIHTEDHPFYLYSLEHDYCDSGNDDRPFLVFHTKEAMQKESKRILLERLEKWHSNYDTVGNWKDMFRKLHDSCSAKNDPEVLSLYNTKLSLFEKEANLKKKEKLQKEVDELALKQKQLQELSNKL